MKKVLFSFCFIALMSVMHNAHAATITYYTKYSDWINAVGGEHSSENFNNVNNTNWTAGLSVVSSNGYIERNRFWHDVLNGNASTQWVFDSATYAFGGDWDLSQNEPGTGIQISLRLTDGSLFDLAQQIPNTAAGNNYFWGFVSDTPFSRVIETEGTQVYNNNYQETYHLDNLVFSKNAPTPTPIPAALWLFGTGVAGLLGLRRRKKA